jgi:hypothetical protein
MGEIACPHITRVAASRFSSAEARRKLFTIFTLVAHFELLAIFFWSLHPQHVASDLQEYPNLQRCTLLTPIIPNLW